MWKTQSPWPTLRGALYDNYLETTGGYWGVRSATGSGLDSLDARGPARLGRRVAKCLANRIAWYVKCKAGC